MQRNRNYYSYKGGYPKLLPDLIPTESGNYLTNDINLSEKILEDNGYIKIPDKPKTSDRFSYVTWQDGNWAIKEMSDEDKQNVLNGQWERIRLERDTFIRGVNWRYERHARLERLGLQQIDNIIELDSYIQALADLPQTQNDPFNIKWPYYQEPENK